MDELNPQQLEELRRTLERLGLSSEQVEDALRAMDKAAKEAGRSLASVIKNLSRLDKDISTNRATMMGLASEMIRGRRVYKDLSNELDLLDEKIEELADSTDTAEKAIRGELIQRREAIQKLTQENAARRAVVDGLSKFSKDVASIGGRTASGLVRNIQDNASAFTTAGGILEGAIDGANAGMQVIGAGLTTVGTTLITRTDPRVRGLGIAASVAGIGISKLSDAAAAAGKIVLNYMVKQMEMTVDAFNKTSASGALFADGLTGMVNAASGAGLTVRQFGEVLKANSDMLAQSGLSVSQGAQYIGRVGKEMNRSGITTSLLKLGYSFEEQAGLVAEVMADMRTANSTLLRDPAGVARATEQYATNLRTIASITGEDAKKKVDESRRQSANVAFRAKMMELEKTSPGLYQRYLLATASMTEQQRQNVMETVVFGNVINDTGATMEAVSSSLAEVTKETSRSILDGTLDVKKNQDLQARGLERFRNNLDEVNAVGMAGMAGLLPDVNRALTNVMLSSDKMTVEGVKAAQTAAEQQKTATDEFTNNVVKAAKEAQELAVKLQDITLRQLGNFAYYSGQIINELKKQLNELGVETGGGPPTQFSFGDMFKEAATWSATGATAGAIMASPGGITAPVGALFGGAAGFIGGAGKSLIDQLYYGKRSFGGAPAGAPATAAGSTKLSDIIQFTPGTGDERHFNMLSTDAQMRFTAMAQEYFDNTGKKLQINSAFRTPEEQAATTSTYGPKAEPGKSLHQQGRALDLNSSDVAALKISGLLGKYGFNTIKNDPPHIELMAKGGITNGPSIAGEAGPEAVIPLPDGRNIPVKMDVGELVEKLNEMIDVLREGNGNTEKIFYASAQ